MSKPQNWLGALLALQIALAGGFFIHHRQAEARQSQSASILAVAREGVDKVVISDKAGKVTLLKKDGRWQLPERQNLPADAQKLDDLLLSLSDLKGGWPVATTAESHEQFELSEKAPSRRIELFSGDKPAGQLLMGSSPGFRKTHVRTPENSNVYAAEITAMDAPSTADEWLDHGLLKAKDPVEIGGPGYRLKKSGADWTLEGPLAANLNKTHAAALAKLLTGLQVQSVQTATAAKAGPASLSLEVSDGGAKMVYSFWLDGDQATVRRNDVATSFTVAKATYDSLASYTLAKLTEKSPQAQASPGQGQAGSAATPSAPGPSPAATP